MDKTTEIESTKLKGSTVRVVNQGWSMHLGFTGLKGPTSEAHSSYFFLFGIT
jgi:hypothetical protein